MTANNEFMTIQLHDLLEHVQAFQRDGLRLVQIMACNLPTDGDAAPATELLYSFDKGYQLRTLRVAVPAGADVPSITPVYLAAYLYENEIRELFGVSIKGIAVDFNGHLYKTATKQAFAIPRLKRNG